MREIEITSRQSNSSSCFVCGLDNPYGLRARFYQTDDKEVVATFTTLEGHQSYPGRLHGGVTSAILDEAIGRAIFCHEGEGVWGVTIALTVSYKKPVPLEVPLKVIGRITSNTSRIFEATGELLLPDGTIAATAEGRYLKQTIETIAKDASGNFMEKEWGLQPAEEMPATITI